MVGPLGKPKWRAPATDLPFQFLKVSEALVRQAKTATLSLDFQEDPFSFVFEAVRGLSLTRGFDVSLYQVTTTVMVVVFSCYVMGFLAGVIASTRREISRAQSVRHTVTGRDT
jgi:hypothetical protein